MTKVKVPEDATLPIFEVITTGGCKYCDLAKQLLTLKGIRYRETILDTFEKKVSFREAGHKTVPQIYRNTLHIGGYDDLVAWLM